ncbi:MULTISPECIES: YveK family protein [unclassified Ruminococcus]|uniref:YveK family protein n=1 Tax=unclassified Ruminococcus TaxID=2608920 RepID=UPI00210D0A87|nr:MULTISPECIES: Wzz/FepE/Etk N-terminal domain-containing protein [unclassified Ruminococcus]
MDEVKEQHSEKEIDLRFIFEIIRKNIIPLVLVTVIAGAISFFGSMIFIPKQYEADAMLIVNNKKNDTQAVNSAEIVAAQNLAEVYSIIIKSDTVLQQVIDDLKLSMTYEQLYKAISVSCIDQTQVISIKMRSTDAEFAKEVIADVVKVAPPIIQDKVDAGSVKVISEARISNNGNPVSPSLKKNAIIGALIGLVITLAFVFIKTFFRNTFKTENDITNTLGVPLLGIIPEIDEKEFAR